ncbi:MAG: exo-alpha-sialidase [Thermoguttaceae bacterium]|nr:exo-alpha-sialidase [Thermoguttaceae bacterium]MBR2584988.1 exo-alpha-sialidase [Thermoguttaceae bacterium]
MKSPFLKSVFYVLIVTVICVLAFPPSASAIEPSPWPWMPKKLVLAMPVVPDNPRNSEGDFVILEDGTILFVYTHYYGDSGDDHASARLMSRSSSDGGKTWTKEDKLDVENEGGLNVMSVSLLRLDDGRVVMFYMVKDSPSDGRPYMRIRQADGTWGERRCLLDEVSYNVLNNDRVVQLASGRILVPLARHTYLGGSLYNYDPNAKIFCLISDDGGETWREGGELEPTEGMIYQEPGLCELADGRILMYIRTDQHAQYFAFSEDGGETWSKPFKSCIDSPCAPTLIKRIPGSDELLAVGNPWLPFEGENDRATMTIERLTPDASKILVRKTMEHLERYVAPAWDYPTFCFPDDNTALVGYSCWPEGVHINIIKLSDL